MTKDKSLADIAYKHLEEAIVTLALKPGEAITEAQLTESLDMGRTPIREAIQRLSWEGLLTIRPRLGIVIADLHPGDFARVMDARHPLELLLTTGAARLASRDDRQRLRECADAMREAASREDTLDFLRLDKTFDEIVAEAACNPFAAKAVAPLQTLSRRFWFRYFREEDLLAAAPGHLDLMLAILSGDEMRTRDLTDELMYFMRRQAAALVAGPEAAA